MSHLSQQAEQVTQPIPYAVEERIDAFCRELAIALRRITRRQALSGGEGTPDALDLPIPVAPPKKGVL